MVAVEGDLGKVVEVVGQPLRAVEEGHGEDQVLRAGLELLRGVAQIGERFAAVLNVAPAERMAPLVKQRQFGILQVVEGRIERREALFKIGQELRETGRSQPPALSSLAELSLVPPDLSPSADSTASAIRAA